MQTRITIQKRGHNGRFCRRRIVSFDAKYDIHFMLYFVQSGEGGTGVRACTTGEGTEGRNNGKGGTGAPDKAIEIRTRRGRGLCYIEKLHRSDSRPDSCFLSFFHFDERLLEPFRRTVSLPCLFTRWLEGERRELIVGVGFIYFFFSTRFPRFFLEILEQA